MRMRARSQMTRCRITGSRRKRNAIDARKRRSKERVKDNSEAVNYSPA